MAQPIFKHLVLVANPFLGVETVQKHRFSSLHSHGKPWVPEAKAASALVEHQASSCIFFIVWKINFW